MIASVKLSRDAEPADANQIKQLLEQEYDEARIQLQHGKITVWNNHEKNQGNTISEDRMEDLVGRQIENLVQSPLTGQSGHFGVILEKEDSDDLPENSFPGLQFKDGEVRYRTFSKQTEGDAQ